MNDKALFSKAATAADLRNLGEFARMAGSSIAGRDAIGWTTHFLNAAYYGVPTDRRELENLHIAWAVLTTFWHRQAAGQLGARHVRRFHHSFREARSPSGSQYPRGLLDHEQLARGAEHLLGSWFSEARTDPDRIGWGIVFQTPRERSTYDPESRLRRAALGPLTPPTTPASEQTWHTYSPVRVPSPEDVVAVLEAPDMWSHFPTDIGRFTALRAGPLRAQTFEIEAIAEIARHVPMLTRCYVTVTRVLDRSRRVELERQVAGLSTNLSRFGHNEPALLPAGGRPIYTVELTAHAGHFLGRARNYLVAFETADGAYLRAVGNWDPMPWHVRLSYAYQGAAAQRAFWCLQSPRHNMLRQFARAAARRQRARGETPRIPPELQPDRHDTQHR